MSEVVNLLECAVDATAEAPAGFRHRRAVVGRALGAELLSCSLYELPPGERTWPYHYHLNNEEWLVVVSGRPTLRTPAGERELRPGDLVAFPDGEEGAHALANGGDDPVRVAIFGTTRFGDAVFPDSDKVGAGPGGDRRYFPRAADVDYWHGETGAG